jgi:hypothetical protein
MTTFELALIAVLALWFSPVLLVAIWLVRDHKHTGREVRARAEMLAATPLPEFDAYELRTWTPPTAPVTYAGGLRLVDQRATVIDLDSRRRGHGTPGGAA